MDLADRQAAITVLQKGPRRVSCTRADFQDVFGLADMGSECLPDDLHTVSEPVVLPFMAVKYARSSDL